MTTGLALSGGGLALALVGYHPVARLIGLGAFYVGMALGASGGYGLLEGEGASPGEVLGGVLMVMASMGCEAVAGARFWGEAESGRRILAAENKTTLQPMLVFPEIGTLPAPGIRIAYPF